MKCFGLKIFREKDLDRVFFNKFTGLRHLLNGKSDPTIFDVGANVGQSVEEYRREFPNASVHSFEPNPEAYDQLHHRFGMRQNVYLNKAALGDKQERKPLTVCVSNPPDASLLSFNLDSGALANFVHPRMGPYHPERVETLEVSVDTLDGYCERRGVKEIDILKIDVQGYEKHVLRGSTTMLSEGRIRIILTEIIFDDVYSEASSLYEVEHIIRPFYFQLYDISHIYKDLERGRTRWVDAMYARL